MATMSRNFPFIDEDLEDYDLAPLAEPEDISPESSRKRFFCRIYSVLPPPPAIFFTPPGARPVFYIVTCYRAM